MTTQCLNGKSKTRFLLLSFTISLFLPFTVSVLRTLKPERVGHTPVKWHLSSLVLRILVQSVAQPLHICSMRVNSSRLSHMIWWPTHWFCINCLKTGQIKQCFSSQSCCRCQKQHHTLQHVEVKARKPQVPPQTLQSPPSHSSLSHYSTPQSHLPPSTVTPNPVVALSCFM